MSGDVLSMTGHISNGNSQVRRGNKRVVSARHKNVRGENALTARRESRHGVSVRQKKRAGGVRARRRRLADNACGRNGCSGKHGNKRGASVRRKNVRGENALTARRGSRHGASAR